MSIHEISSAEQLFKFLRQSGAKLLANMIYTDSPGHQIHELDYFLRKYLAHDIDRGARHYWIHRASGISRGVIETYGPHLARFNIEMVADNDLYDWSAEICRMVPELGVDVGLGHVRNSLMATGDATIRNFHGRLHYVVSNNAVMQDNRNYYRLRSLTGDLDVWGSAKPAIEGALAEFIGGNSDRIAAIHLRASSGNAGFAVPPENLLPSLAFLRDEGYRLIKVGTEPFPPLFAEFGVLNYSESPLRAFKNDLAILANAKITLINSSGLENVADVMNLPCVSFGNWPLTSVTYSKNTVMVPALMSDRQRGRILTFSEQILFYRSRPEYWETDKLGQHVQPGRFDAILPRPDEILAATQEALELGRAQKPLSELQTRFKQLDAAGLMALAESRVGEFFLQRFQQLI